MAHNKKHGDRTRGVSDGARRDQIVMPDFLTLADETSPLERAASARLEIRSIVLDVTDDGCFLLKGGLAVRTLAATRYVAGSSADIEPGARMRINGTLGDDGVVIAERVTFSAHGGTIRGRLGNE